MVAEGYEDFKYLSGVTVLGTEVNIPVEVKGSEVIFEVKIVGSTVTLDVNITNAELNVKITNATVTVEVQGDVYIKNAVDPNTGDSIPIEINIIGSSVTLDVNITNTELNVNIVNTSLNVKATIVDSEVTLDVNITNTQIHVIIDNAVLDVNITNSSLDVNVLGGELNVNVGTFPFEKASENILENPGFETGDASGWKWSTTLTVTVQSTVKKGGSYAAKIVSNGNYGDFYTDKAYQCQPGQEIMLTGWVYREANVDYLKARIWFYTIDGSNITLRELNLSSISADTWTEFKHVVEAPDGAAYFRVGFTIKNTDGSSAVYVDSLHVPRMVLVGHSTEIPINMNIASQSVDIEVVIKSSNVTLDVNITGSDVDIPVVINAQNVTLDVNIVGQDQDINVKITGQEVTLNVSVEGTASVSIDNATVYLNVKNEEYKGIGKVIKTADVSEYDTDVDAAGSWWGFYFPHNMRGLINHIRVYAKNTTGSDQTIEVRLKLAPNYPTLFSTSFTISATQTDYGLIMSPILYWYWQYESLFIEIKAPSGVYLGCKSSGWYDGGFKDEAYRNWYPILEIWYAAKTSGDIPVSGTVNTINIPNKSSPIHISDEIGVSAGETETLVDAKGIGKCPLFRIKFTGSGFDPDSSLIKLHITVDGNTYTLPMYKITSMTGEKVGDKIKWLYYDPTNNIYVLEFSDVFEFQRELKIELENGTSNGFNARVLAVFNWIGGTTDIAGTTFHIA